MARPSLMPLTLTLFASQPDRDYDDADAVLSMRLWSPLGENRASRSRLVDSSEMAGLNQPVAGR
jgi:hypothetical protein